MYADRVQESSTSTGTGTITLGGAITGFRSFSSVYANADVVRYAIVGGAEWEIGEGTYSGGTITRDLQVFSSSNAGALVNFSAGTKAVFIDVPAVFVSDGGINMAFRNLMYTPG